MNKILQPGSWILPALLLLGIVFTFTLSGCGRGGNELRIDEDSAKPHAISIAEASALTANFRNAVDTLAKKLPELKDSLNFGYSEAFNSDVYRILLRQTDSTGKPAAGIRIYYGRGKTGEVQLVLVPYDRKGNDILRHLISLDNKPVPGTSPARTKDLTSDDAQAMEQGQHCPTNCPAQTSPLEP